MEDVQLWHTYVKWRNGLLKCVYRPTELVLEDASMSCRYRLWRILILILVNGATKAKGLDVRHEQHEGNCPRSVFVMDQR